MSKLEQLIDDTNLTKDNDCNEMHVINGLTAEVGEIASLYQKYYRSYYNTSFKNMGYAAYKQREAYLKGERDSKIREELCDVLYYTVASLNHFGFTLEDAVDFLDKKLRDRKARGVIEGKGDNR